MSGGAGYVLSRQGSGVRSGLRGRIRAFSWIRAAGSDPGCGVRSGLQGRIRAAGSPPGSGVGSGQRGRIRAAGSPPGSGVGSELLVGSGLRTFVTNDFFSLNIH